jgi:hypothetical protein
MHHSLFGYTEKQRCESMVHTEDRHKKSALQKKTTVARKIARDAI